MTTYHPSPSHSGMVMGGPFAGGWCFGVAWPRRRKFDRDAPDDGPVRLAHAQRVTDYVPVSASRVMKLVIMRYPRALHQRAQAHGEALQRR
jgi:hypothetical protein